MRFWINRIARLLAFFVFFIVLFNGISYEDPFDMVFLMPSLIKAIIGAALFWVAGTIISDIVLKGIVEDIPNEDLDLLDGGIIQRMKQYGKSDKFKSIADDVKHELPKKEEKEEES